VLRALRLIGAAPALWPWALVPAVVLLVLESAFVSLAFFVLRPEVLERLPEATTFWTRLAGYAASTAVVLTTAIIGWFVALMLAPPLSAPALEHLVARVEHEIGAPPRPPVSFFSELVSGFRSMIGAALFGVPILLGLSLVELALPPLVIVTVPLKVVVTSLLVAWGLFDYPLSLRGVGFRDRLGLMSRHLPGVLGFGLTFAALFWVPCCGVLFLPVGAAAATLVGCRILAQTGAADGPSRAELGPAPGGS
jgi:uncharacterized protein involved in cysteine biosynthesis